MANLFPPNRLKMIPLIKCFSLRDEKKMTGQIYFLRIRQHFQSKVNQIAFYLIYLIFYIAIYSIALIQSSLKTLSQTV